MNNSVISLHLKLLNLGIIPAPEWGLMKESLRDGKMLGPFTYGFIIGDWLYCLHCLKLYCKEQEGSIYGIGYDGTGYLTDYVFRENLHYVNSIGEGVGQDIHEHVVFLSNYKVPERLFNRQLDTSKYVIEYF